MLGKILKNNRKRPEVLNVDDTPFPIFVAEMPHAVPRDCSYELCRS